MAMAQNANLVCITVSSCAWKSPDLSNVCACFAQVWRLLSSLVVAGCC
jgi:hypothetical protein